MAQRLAANGIMSAFFGEQCGCDAPVHFREQPYFHARADGADGHEPDRGLLYDRLSVSAGQAAASTAPAELPGRCPVIGHTTSRAEQGPGALVDRDIGRGRRLGERFRRPLIGRTGTFRSVVEIKETHLFARFHDDFCSRPIWPRPFWQPTRPAAARPRRRGHDGSQYTLISGSSQP